MSGEPIKGVGEFIAGDGIRLQRYRDQLVISRDNPAYGPDDTINALGLNLTGDFTAANATLSGSIKTSDLITNGPWVDIRSSMDGVAGRPTYATWVANQATTSTNSVWTAIIGSNKHILLPNGIFYTTGITIPDSTMDLLIEGINDNRNLGSTVIQGGTGVTLFTFGNNCLNIKFKRMTFYNANIVFSLPNGKLLNNVIFEECTFLTISDKVFQVLDTSSGGGGLVKGTFGNCVFYDVANGFYSVSNAMVNNLHFDNCSWENPKNGGYQVYVGGIDGSTINTNISIENSLFNGTLSTTTIPICWKNRYSKPEKSTL